MTDQPRWGLYADRRYGLDTFINLLYGLALDQYGEMLTKSELGRVCVDTIDMTGSSDCVGAVSTPGGWARTSTCITHCGSGTAPPAGCCASAALSGSWGGVSHWTISPATAAWLCSSNGVPREEWREKCPHMSDRLRDRLGIVPLPFAVNGEH
jgi:hypothetical protein